MTPFLKYITLLFAITCCLSGCAENDTPIILAQTPPMGWNSFDSYGVYLHEKAAMENIEAFAEKLKPYGYEYFVIDAGWFGEFELREGSMISKERHAKRLNVNDCGLLQPSKTYFPNGFGPIINRCHELGIKFGVHLMRGIPRIAVEKNLPIKGTGYHARDIADTCSVCKWCPQNYGIDMDKPGAQEYYNSLIDQLAGWGVDFIKYDDIVKYPKEVQGVVNAIKRNGRPIVLSLSPGGRDVINDAFDVYRQANMIRVTPDIWDEQSHIDLCFNAWKEWQGYFQKGFWIDMDMIPFGQLQLMSPKPEILSGNESYEEAKTIIKRAVEENKASELLAGRGWTRWCKLSEDQMKTFITLRAMSASPLMVGGDLPTMDDFSLYLLTHKEIIACNQNGIMGHLIDKKGNVEIWKTPSETFDGGWLGLFNRSNKPDNVAISFKELKLENNKYSLFDIFKNQPITDSNFSIPANGVIFIKFTRNNK